jgi:hypothetical protein
MIADDTALVTAELLKLLSAVSIGGKQVHDALCARMTATTPH